MNQTRSAPLTGRARAAAAADCREYYEAGNSVRSVADRFGRSYGSTHQLLVEAGTQFRGKDGQPRKQATTTRSAP